MSKLPTANITLTARMDRPDTFNGSLDAESCAQLTHLLHFEPLSAGDAGLDVPCDPQGRVGLDALTEKLRNDYFFARTLIGRLFAAPTVRLVPGLSRTRA
ncbi:MAG: hypothetical protein EOP39_11710 [Rubrivivax sp.]|nr:MAG: hypothetical protein EOP39_11710 [Rubrivivax sp.]